jgi:hypothetical protein
LGSLKIGFLFGYNCDFEIAEGWCRAQSQIAQKFITLLAMTLIKRYFSASFVFRQPITLQPILAIVRHK